MKSKSPILTKRELATVLSALRHWQEGFLHESYSESEVKAMFPHFRDAKPLTIDEVDALCQKLNV